MLLQAGGTRLILRRLDADGVLLQQEESGECRRLSEAQLLEAIFAGLVQTEQQRRKTPFDLSAAVLDRAQVRGASARSIEVWENKMAWLNGLRAKGVTQIVNKAWVRAAINQLARDELKGLPRFAITTLYETDLKIRKSGGDPTAVVPDFASRGGRDHLRIDERTAELVTTEIQRVRDETTGPIVKKVIYQSITAIINARNAGVPGDPIPHAGSSTVNRLISRLIPAYEVTRRNKGPRAAARAFREHAHARDTAMWPLEVGEYDDIDTGVFATDERNGLPWGRVYLTNGLSQSTLAVLGYDLGDKPRSYQSAIATICESLLPKDDCLPGEMGYGNQGTMLLDNASYNACKAMRTQSRALSLLLASARPYGPTEKSGIEHFNWIVKSDFCRGLPGWSGPKGDREAVNEGLCSAALTLGQISQDYRHWVTKIYANKPGDDGLTPKQRWLQHYAHHGPAVRYSKAQLSLFRLRPDTSKFRESGGLMRLGLRYASEELVDLRRLLGETAEVQIFVDASDLSYLVVADPMTGNLLRVPSSEDKRYVANLTERQQQMILSMARERGIKNPSLDELWKSRRDLERMVQQASRANRLRKRTWARRMASKAAQGQQENHPSGADPSDQGTRKSETRLMTELEYQVEELLAVDLAPEDEW